jgi:hypothetical protein
MMEQQQQQQQQQQQDYLHPSNLYDKSEMRVRNHLNNVVSKAVPKEPIPAIAAESFEPCYSEPSSSHIVVRIIIKNNSKHTLESCSSGSERGYFLTGDGTAAPSFAGPNGTIQTGYSAGFVHMKTVVSVFGSRGYIVFRISAENGDNVIAFGWDVAALKPNSVALDLRAATGRVEPSVHVDKVKKIINRTHGGQSGLEEFNQKIEGICRITCAFDNGRQPTYKLTIDDLLM